MAEGAVAVPASGICLDATQPAIPVDAKSMPPSPSYLGEVPGGCTPQRPTLTSGGASSSTSPAAPAAAAAVALAAKVAAEATATSASLTAAAHAVGLPGPQQTPEHAAGCLQSPRWQVSPVTHAEALLSGPASASPLVPTPLWRNTWDSSPHGSGGTPRKSLVYSATPSSGTVTISSVATPLRSPSSCCSPSRMQMSPHGFRTTLLSTGRRPSVVVAAAALGSSPGAERRRRSSPPECSRLAERWHQMYVREVGRMPTTAEQLRAFVIHRGGDLPWCVARRIIPVTQASVVRTGIEQGG